LPVYIWTGDKWEEKANGEIKKAKYAIFGTKFPKASTESIYEYFQGKGQYTNVKPKPSHLIAFQNGLFNLKTEKLEPLTPEYFVINTLPINYNPKAKCPKFQKFQKEIHYPEDIDFINEWFAYNFYTSYERAMFVILIGNGQNGKTVELAVLQGILGEENVNNSSIQQLTYSQYGPAEPYHKLAVIGDDITNQKLKQTGILKSLSAGASINARRIYGYPFDYTNYAKITAACNEPPEIIDDSDGLWNRLKFIDYPNKFAENPIEGTNERQAKEKRQLIKDLLEEKEGITKLLVDTLLKLYKNGFKFTYNKSTKDVREYYRRKSKPTICWIEECIISTNDDSKYFFKDKSYPHFKQWCKNNKIKTVPSGQKFFSTLIDEGFSWTQPRELNKKRVCLGYELHDTATHPLSYLSPSTARTTTNSKISQTRILNSCVTVSKPILGSEKEAS